MGTRIAYRINYEKAIEALVFLAEQQPGIDIYHVAKVLFYADKMHVNKFARPILGDTYICMNHGPVPSGVRDLITDNPWLSPDLVDKKCTSLEIEGSRFNLTAKRKPNLDYFSKTDLDCLRTALLEHGKKPFGELREQTHDEKCYIESGINQPIDYALLVDDDNPNRNAILEEMEEAAAYVQL
ncbi:MAG: SocA family protein [Deltaproteobacteria bacterium]|nr:SocA family protein [Deltaproteobacteria bacterium]